MKLSTAERRSERGEPLPFFGKNEEREQCGAVMPKKNGMEEKLLADLRGKQGRCFCNFLAVNMIYSANMETTAGRDALTRREEGWMKTVWLEWFLLDNLLMGFLILKCAEAFAGKRLHGPMTAVVCAGSAAAAAAAMKVTVLLSLPAKTLLLGWMTAAFLPKGPKEILRCTGCVLLSTCLLGGAAYGLCGALAGKFSGGVLYAGVSVRAVLAAAAVGCILPGKIRAMVAARRLGKRDVTVQVDTDCGTTVLHGRLDTGNALREPLSGLPVLVVDARAAGTVLPRAWETSWQEAPQKGMLLVPYQTVDGTGVMPALKGRGKLEEGEAQPCCVALSPRRLKDCEAVINAELFA